MRTPLVDGALAACVVACSTETTAAAALPPDALVLEASAAMREELGVTQWALRNEG